MSGIVTRLCTAVIATSAIAIFTTGCGSDPEPRAIAESSSSAGSESATTTTATPSPTKINGQEGTDAGGDIDIDVSVGDCVKLGGTVDDAEIDNAVCGSAESNYKVIAKVPTSDQCPSDVDQYYYETLFGQEQGAVCLDVDWVVGGCMDLGPGDADSDPVRIECDDPTGEDVMQVTEILQGSTSVEDCGSESDSGFKYTERMFTVCTATI